MWLTDYVNTLGFLFYWGSIVLAVIIPFGFLFLVSVGIVKITDKKASQVQDKRIENELQRMIHESRR